MLLTPELLIDVLSLPKDTEVLSARMTGDLRNIELIVAHPDIRGAELQPQFRRDPDGTVRFLGWGERR